MTVSISIAKRANPCSQALLNLASGSSRHNSCSRLPAWRFALSQSAVLAAVLALSVGCAARAHAASTETNTTVPAAAPGFAGSRSCQECHAKFYQLWSTSFHGLAMQPYTRELAKTKLTPQEKEVVAGDY